MSHRHLVSRLLPARDQLTLERAKKIVDRRQREIAFIARSPPCSLFGGWVGHCPPLITSSQRVRCPNRENVGLGSDGEAWHAPSEAARTRAWS